MNNNMNAVFAILCLAVSALAAPVQVTLYTESY